VIPLDEAQWFVQSTLSFLPVVDLSLDEALGCVAGEEVLAREPVPGFANSSMDGYAVRSIDTRTAPARLQVVDSIMAGDVSSVHVGSRQAARIMTGAPVPAGADCVCMIEETTVESGGRVVVIDRSIPAGEFVRSPGADVAVGQVLIAAGDELGPVHLGVLAGQGITSLLVHPRPRVGVLSTGNELVGPLYRLGEGKIRDVNRPMLLALLRQSGFEPVDLGIAVDDVTSITERFEQGVQRCDAVISTGGVSVGDVDYVKAVLADLCGAKARSMQVAIKPGKPFTFGTTGPRGTPLFGLAGNPVSTLVGFELFVRPALRLLAGHEATRRPEITMALDCPITRTRDGKLHLVHVKARFGHDGRVHVERTMRQGSHLLSAVTGANAIAMVPDGDGLDIGQTVKGMFLGPDVVTDEGVASDETSVQEVHPRPFRPSLGRADD
jgi:molybdenum cofactor synthesis domain-containing protein